MSLKCSVLGHRFDETSVERERHEEGTEVVITITEVESCSRCGESRVVSENKEVTTMEAHDEDGDASGTAPDVSSDDDGDEDDSDGESADARDAGPVTDDAGPVTDDAEIIEAGAESESTAQTTARSETAIPDAEGGTTATEDDDGIIVDSGDAPADGAAPDDAATPADPPASDDAETEDREESERAPGSWPDEPERDAGGASGAAEWPGDDAREGSRDDVADVGGGSVEWPDDGREDTGATSAGPDLEPAEGPTITVPEGMFKCSECGFTTEVESSSLRAGDFCPECHRGTLVQDSDSPSSD